MGLEINDISVSSSFSATSISADTVFVGALSATSISGDTFFSGGTPLESVIYSISTGTEDITRVQNGLNTYTGGTNNSPAVNISAATLSSLFVSGESRFFSLSATSLSATSYFNDSQQIFGIVRSNVAPINTGNTWVRTTDDSVFSFDSTRNVWLSVYEEVFSGSRDSGLAGTQFLRHFDNVTYNNTPYRSPYNAYVTRITMSSAASSTWRGVVTTGITIGTNNIIDLQVISGTYTAKTDYSQRVYSGQTLYLAMSGSSVNRPLLNVYLRQIG